MKNVYENSSLDKIDPSTKVLIKNLMPLSDSYTDSTGFPAHKKTQTKNKLSKIKSQIRKGSFSVSEKQKINDTLCEYALSNDLSTEQIISYLKSNYIEKKSSIFNLDLEDKDSLLYHLSVAVPSRSINSIIKYILNRYCHFDDSKNGNKNKSIVRENKKPIYTSLNSDTKEKKEDKISSDISSFVIEEKRSPLIMQMALLQSIQHFLDKFLKNSIKGYKLIKNNYEFVPKTNLNEKEYKLDLVEGKIIISEELKESKDHKTNIFYIKSSFDLGVLFKIHYDKIKFNWEEMKKIYEKNIPEEDKDLYNLSEKEIEQARQQIKDANICSSRTAENEVQKAVNQANLKYQRVLELNDMSTEVNT